MRTLKALEFASNRKAKVITLTDSVHSPMNLYSSCNLLARSDMVSIVDSLVAPLSVINALVVALCLKQPEAVKQNLETLEQVWNNYQVYLNDEINFIDRDDVTHCSTHYTLADFGTTGQFGVRNNEDYLKNYFINRYGGIKDIDFTPVFETIIRNNQKKEEAHAQEDK